MTKLYIFGYTILIYYFNGTAMRLHSLKTSEYFKGIANWLYSSNSFQKNSTLALAVTQPFRLQTSQSLSLSLSLNSSFDFFSFVSAAALIGLDWIGLDSLYENHQMSFSY